MASWSDFPEANTYLKPAKGDEGRVGTLPVYIDDKHAISLWDFNPQELAAVVEKGEVWLVVLHCHAVLAVPRIFAEKLNSNTDFSSDSESACLYIYSDYRHSIFRRKLTETEVRYASEFGQVWLAVSHNNSPLAPVCIFGEKPQDLSNPFNY